MRLFHLFSLLLLTYMLVSLYVHSQPEQGAAPLVHASETVSSENIEAEAMTMIEQERTIHAVEDEGIQHTITVSSSSQPESIQIVGPNEKQLEAMEKVQVVATGYTAGYESTGKTPDHPEYGITYSGIKVRRDHLSTIAADLELFPLGTILWIPDYGYGIVSDIGGAIKGNKIDLYFETEDDVYRYWGKKTVDVYVVEKGNGELTEAMFGEKIEAFAG